MAGAVVVATVTVAAVWVISSAVAAAEDKLLYLLQGCETDRKIGAAELLKEVSSSVADKLAEALRRRRAAQAAESAATSTPT